MLKMDYSAWQALFEMIDPNDEAVDTPDNRKEARLKVQEIRYEVERLNRTIDAYREILRQEFIR